MSEKIRQQTVPRIFFDETVTISSPGRETPMQGHALNLSSGGIYICAPEALEQGQTVELHFCLPDGDPITAQATVLRAVASHTPLEPVGMALRFDRLEPDYAERVERFINGRLQPATGEVVRLQLDGHDVTIKAKTQSYWQDFLALDAELPFLRLGSTVTLQPSETGQLTGSGHIRWVSVHIPPQTGVPRLNIGIELLSAEGEQEVNEDDDPVCNPEFIEHSQKLDKKVRAERKAATVSSSN